MALARPKRKDSSAIDDFTLHFSHVSLSRKTRRLDADLPPIMEEEEPFSLTLEAPRRSAIVLFKSPPPSSFDFSIFNAGQLLRSSSVKRESFHEDRRSLPVIPWSPAPTAIEGDSMDEDATTSDVVRATQSGQQQHCMVSQHVHVIFSSAK